MAIVYDTDSETQGTSTTTLTITSLVVGNNANRVLIVCTGSESGTAGNRPVSSITWNTTETFSRAVFVENASGGPNRSEIWYLINPTATTANIVVTFGGAAFNTKMSVLSIYGAHQTTPIDGVATNTENDDDPDITITTNTLNCLLVDSVMMSAASLVLTPDTPQVEISNQNGSSSTHLSSYKDAATITTYTMSWAGVSAAQNSIVAAAIKPAVGVSQVYIHSMAMTGVGL